LRERAKLTQERLAHAAGLTTSAVSNVERGQKAPSFMTVLKLARGLKVDAGELFVAQTTVVQIRFRRLIDSCRMALAAPSFRSHPESTSSTC